MPQNGSRGIVIGPEGFIGQLKVFEKAKIDSCMRSKGTGFFSRKSGSKQLDFFSCKSERKVDLIRRCYNRQVTYFFITVYTYK